MRKVLWVVDGDKDALLERAKYVGAQAVCIRTTNAWLKGSVQAIKQWGFDVYAWRWPSVDPSSNTNHHYVEAEIDFVKGLIAEGLDGYIVDPEADDGRDSDNWNDSSLAPLADHFCGAIKSAGRQKNPNFLFGTTSGCDYPVIKPDIPWSTFLAHSDAVFPQIYWAPNFIKAKRTTPDAAWKIGMTAWSKILSNGMPVRPILGEIAINTPDEIARFGQIMIDHQNTGEVHFYTYEKEMLDPQWKATWDALRSLGAAVAGHGVPQGPAKAHEQKEEKVPTGLGMLQRARQHIGEDYVLGVVAPKNNPNWKGPWDCAEFMSWLTFQEAQTLYGCTNDNSPPAVADAYTGAWRDDSARLGMRIPVAEAAGTVGGILLRFPPASGGIGHIAICDGQGGTVEAKGAAFGVVADKVQDRYWDTGVKIPGVQYAPATPFQWIPPAASQLYWLGGSDMDPAVVTKIQQSLAARGFDPGPIDGEFGNNTAAAVAAFQATKGLVVDGQVGPETASALGVVLV